jgi:hypothetical protein
VANLWRVLNRFFNGFQKVSVLLEHILRLFSSPERLGAENLVECDFLAKFG